MGILDRLMGRDQEQTPSQANGQGVTDEQAIERYRYLLRTAPPETIEQVHAEAFAQLTPEQRRQVLEQLRQATPERERQYAKDDPATLAQMATRAELRQPGILERMFGGMGSVGGGMMGGGIGLGGLMAGSFLTSLAGSLIGNAVAQEFFHHSGAGFADGLGGGGYGFADTAQPDDMYANADDSSGGSDLGQELGPMDDDVGSDFDSGDLDV